MKNSQDWIAILKILNDSSQNFQTMEKTEEHCLKYYRKDPGG